MAETPPPPTGSTGTPSPDDVLNMSPDELMAYLNQTGSLGSVYDVFTSSIDPQTQVYAGKQSKTAYTVYTNELGHGYGKKISKGTLVAHGGTGTLTHDDGTTEDVMVGTNGDIYTVYDWNGTKVGGTKIGHAEMATTTADQETNVGELLKSWYSMDPAERSRVQRLMFAGGFYGNSNLKDVQFGTADEAGFSAWAAAVSRAARFNAAGKKMTVDDVLSEAARSGGAVGQGKNITVSLTDPLALNDAIDRVATNVLGRKANVGEQRMFTSIIHEMESAAQTAAQGGGAASTPVGQPGIDLNTPEVPITVAHPDLLTGTQLPGTPGWIAPTNGPTKPDVSLDDLQRYQQTADTATTVTSPDQGAQAEALLRAQHPDEAGAHDIANQFSNFLRILTGGVR